MRRIIIAVLLACPLVPSPAAAQPDDADYAYGNGLLTYCTSPLGTVAQAYCVGYVSAATDFLAIMAVPVRRHIQLVVKMWTL